MLINLLKNRSDEEERLRMRCVLIDSSMPEPNSGCWLWLKYTKKRNRHSYGYTFFMGNKMYAHRASFVIFKSEIPEKMMVCHKCDNPSCINPDHLFLGTQKQNIRDMVKKNRGPDRRGSKHPNVKLTEDKILEIRRLSLSGLKNIRIAERFNLDPARISGIIRRVVWKHV